jgi:hypothetical protein
MDEVEIMQAIKASANNAGNIQDKATRDLFLELLAILGGLQVQIIDMQPMEDDQ